MNKIYYSNPMPLPQSMIQDGFPILKWYFMSLRTNSTISSGKRCKKGGSLLSFMEQNAQKSILGSSELSFKALELKLWNQPLNSNHTRQFLDFFDRRSLTSNFDLQPPKIAIFSYCCNIETNSNCFKCIITIPRVVGHLGAV